MQLLDGTQFTQNAQNTIQSHLCYRYTIPHLDAASRLSALTFVSRAIRLKSVTLSSDARSDARQGVRANFNLSFLWELAMSMTRNSTTSSRPAKPGDDFPLYAHNSGRWAKKIRGKTHFFGPWRDPWGAMARYHKEKDDLEAGRIPEREARPDALTVKKMVGLFLDNKKLMVESGQMVQETWNEYERYGRRMIRVFGANTHVERLGPSDFQRLRADFQKTHKSLVSIKGDVRKTKVFFNWAGPGEHGMGYFDKMPRFGEALRAPAQSALDREREDQVERVFTAAQINLLLATARPNIKAMILLGVNCGYGNKDCGRLVFSKVDLKGGWATFARTKNGNKRRCPLWPETVAALQAWIAVRPKPRTPGYAKYVFLTHLGQPFSSANLSHEFEKLAVEVGMTREEADFYDLRRTCNSIGVQVSDDDAVRTIMGHKRAANDMLGVYNRLQVDDSRLHRATNHVRSWLFTPPTPVLESDDGDAPTVVPFAQVG